MDVRVELRWFDGEPTLAIEDGPDGLVALVDPRLSEQQVNAACAELDGVGDAVFQQWQALVGLSREGGPAR